MEPPYHITVSLGIVTIPNRINFFKNLLNSIFAGSQLPDEIIIVINGIKDSNNSRLSSYIKLLSNIEHKPDKPIIKCICLAENVPVGYCRALLVKYAVCDYIAIVDDDVLIDRSWMEKIRRSLILRPDIVAGRVEPYPNTPTNVISYLDKYPYFKHFVFISNYEFMRIRYAISEDLFLIDGIGGVWANNMIIKKDLIEHVGNFNIILGYYKDDIGGEDTEFKMRARKLGAVFLYNSGVVVYHVINPERLTYSYIFKRAWQHGLLYSYIYQLRLLIKAFFGGFLLIFYYFLIDRKKEFFLAITRFISMLSALLSIKKREDFIDERLSAIRRARYKILTV